MRGGPRLEQPPRGRRHDGAAAGALPARLAGHRADRVARGGLGRSNVRLARPSRHGSKTAPPQSAARAAYAANPHGAVGLVKAHVEPVEKAAPARQKQQAGVPPAPAQAAAAVRSRRLCGEGCPPCPPCLAFSDRRQGAPQRRRPGAPLPPPPGLAEAAPVASAPPFSTQRRISDAWRRPASRTFSARCLPPLPGRRGRTAPPALQRP